MTLNCSLTCNENLVVSLGLITHHADFVALAMVDVDMNCSLKRQCLKIRPTVVDVYDRSKVGPIQ
jgi:hypothetical protein